MNCGYKVCSSVKCRKADRADPLATVEMSIDFPGGTVHFQVVLKCMVPIRGGSRDTVTMELLRNNVLFWLLIPHV